MNNYCTLFIVRHGQTQWNVKGLLQGQADSPLTKLGINQAKILGEQLKNIHFDAIFSSDSLRAKRTARFITMERKMVIKTTKLLRERSFGKFEGKPYLQLDQELKDLLIELEKLTDVEKLKFKTPEMESDEELFIRFNTFLREIAVAFAGKTILVVTHGGMIRSLLIHLGFGTYSQIPHSAISNGGFIKLESDGVDYFIRQTQGVSKTA